MAIYGFEHGGSRRYARAMERLLGSESADAPMPPGFIIELDPPELRSLHEKRDWTTGRVSQVLNATHTAQIEVFNPANSGIIVVVEGVAVLEPVAGQNYYVILDGTASGGAVIKPLPLDTRVLSITTQASSGVPDLSIGAQQILDELVIAGTTSLAFTLFASRSVSLAPNHRLKVETVNVNQPLVAAIWGYERPATPDELAK